MANRLVSPRPLSRIPEWARPAAGVAVLFGIAPEALNDSRLGRTLDALTDGCSPASGTPSPLLEDLQARITLQFMRRFGVKAEKLGLDTTSLYFEGDCDASEPIRLGYGRDHRPGRGQAVVRAPMPPWRKAPSSMAGSTLATAPIPLPGAKPSSIPSRSWRRRGPLLTTDRGMTTPPVVHALHAAVMCTGPTCLSCAALAASSSP